jgi:hypothetical protein
MREKSGAYIWFWLGNLKERYHFENLGVEGRFK